MSTLRANAVKPITSGNSLVLQGDSGGSGVTGVTIDSSGDTILSGDLNPGSGPANFVGLIAPFGKASGTIDGWLYCDGSAVSRSTYSVLFGVIGETWGAGDGSSTFAIPDLEGAFLRGTGSQPLVAAGGGGQKADGSAFAGPSVGSFENDQIQKFKSQLRSGSQLAVAGGSTASLGYDNPSLGAAVTIGTFLADGFGTPRTGDETRPFNAGVRYYIKY